MTLSIRSLTAADLDRLVVLNNAAVPAVPTTSGSDFATLLAMSDHAFGIVGGSHADKVADDAALIGFVVGMNPGREYESENYRFFEARGTDSFYVDRIVVDEERRGQRIGQRLYERVFEIARAEGRAEVTCEVNLVPPNPRSLAFHTRLGFVEVGRQVTKGETVQVALLAAPVL